MHELVWLLVVRLNMSVGDLVYALILFETCVREHPGLLALHNVRRLYLTCCSLSVKITQDVRPWAGVGTNSRTHTPLVCLASPYP